MGNVVAREKKRIKKEFHASLECIRSKEDFASRCEDFFITVIALFDIGSCSRYIWTYARLIPYK